MKGAENMTVSKNPTSLKLSMDVENGTNTLGAMQTKSTSVGESAVSGLYKEKEFRFFLPFRW